MEFRILGPLEVLDGEGRVLPLGGAKQRATLAMLLLLRNQAVSKERLIDGLWGTSPPPAAEATLKAYISRLRRVLPDDERGARLTTHPPGYRLRVDADELDLERFQTLLVRGRTARAAGDDAAARDALRESLALFRGTPLEDLAHIPFAQGEVGRLEEARLGALEQRIQADLATGATAEVVGELESLVTLYPLREALWSQLMLALYRSKRQGEALIAFDRARRTLADELGVDPGPALRALQQRMLQQDPTLEPALMPGASAPPARGGRSGSPGPAPTVDDATPVAALPADAVAASSAPERVPAPKPWRRRRTMAAVAVALVAGAGAVLVPRLVGDGAIVSGGYRPGTVLINLSTGREITDIPLDQLAVAAYPVFAGGHFWVNNWDPSGYVEIDPKTGAILQRINPPARDPDIHRDFETVTPFTVQGNKLWVTSGDDLVEMDIALGQEVDRFKLDDIGQGSGLAEGVAVGGGSVWVSRDVGRGQILRLSPVTGSAEQVWNDVTPYLNLSYGDGSVWMADERGIARIDGETNVLSVVNGIQNNCGGGSGGCVVAGGGFGWTTDGSKGATYKVDRAGHIAATYATGVGSAFISYRDDVLWVANPDDGTVTGIDALTGRIKTRYAFGHPAVEVVGGDGVLLVRVEAGLPLEARIDSLTGTVAKFFAHWNELGAGEPALSTDPGAYEIEFATCAKLLNYPDKPPPEGWRLQPEVAAAMPRMSGDRRTYTFRILPGYRFSPPSNQLVTAETFRYSIERAVSPRLAEGPVVSNPPGPHVIDDIEGERAFLDRTASHISGLRAAGNTLSITLVRPSPDFLERLALPFFCPVPVGTAFVAGAPHRAVPGGDGSIVSAGPYYVAYYGGDGYVILKRNPNYHGPRPHALDAIAIREDADASAALDLVQNAGWDGITSLPDTALAPHGFVDERWGAHSAAAAKGDQRYFLTPQAATRYIAFNESRGPFADPVIRRAAALALDRTALAAAWEEGPTDQLLSPALPGYEHRPRSRLEPSAARARQLMHGRSLRATLPISSGCAPCAQAARLVHRDLAVIGIDVQIRAVDNLAQALTVGSGFDLLDTSSAVLYPDAASFLEQMVVDTPSGWIPANVEAMVHHVVGMNGDDRQVAAAALADRIVTDEVSVAPYATAETSQLVDPGVGCRVFTPFSYGLDLAALCAK